MGACVCDILLYVVAGLDGEVFHWWMSIVTLL